MKLLNLVTFGVKLCLLRSNFLLIITLGHKHRRKLPFRLTFQSSVSCYKIFSLSLIKAAPINGNFRKGQFILGWKRKLKLIYNVTLHWFDIEGASALSHKRNWK